MYQRADILDGRDPLAIPFFGAVMVHAGVVLLVFGGWFWLNRHRDTLGDINPAGGPAYAVSSVKSIPIPQQQAPPSPVANDTQSQVPAEPAKQEAQKQPPPPDKTAIEIPDKVKRQAPRPIRQQQYQQPTPPNQVYSQSRQALSNPMYEAAAGAGQVGVGPNTPLGDSRLGYYAELVRQQIAGNWVTNGLDQRAQQTPAIVSFTIMRDGTIRDVRTVRSSGNYTIDNSAERAVASSNGKLPPLPPQITEPYITAQFTFNLR